MPESVLLPSFMHFFLRDEGEKKLFVVVQFLLLGIKRVLILNSKIEQIYYGNNGGRNVGFLFLKKAIYFLLTKSI
jgi:hypothetical protein